jgi:hypothetical protein
MKAIAFDTLEFAEQLKAADFTDLQARTLAKAVAAIVDEQLATKKDLEELKVELKRDIREMELRLKHDLTLRLGGMLAASVAIVAALVKLL